MAFLAMFSRSVNGPFVSLSFSIISSHFLISFSVRMHVSSVFAFVINFSKGKIYIFMCVITQLNVCINTKSMRGEKTWHGVGEVEVVAGLDHGQEEDHSAICHLGKDLDGYLALAEALDEDGGGVPIRMYVQGFRGFQDGGGPIRSMDMDCHTLVMD